MAGKVRALLLIGNDRICLQRKSLRWMQSVSVLRLVNGYQRQRNFGRRRADCGGVGSGVRRPAPNQVQLRLAGEHVHRVRRTRNLQRARDRCGVSTRDGEHHGHRHQSTLRLRDAQYSDGDDRAHPKLTKCRIARWRMTRRQRGRRDPATSRCRLNWFRGACCHPGHHVAWCHCRLATRRAPMAPRAPKMRERVAGSGTAVGA